MEKFIEKTLAKYNNSLDEKPYISVILYIMLIILLSLGYLISTTVYQSFNFFINRGIILRFIEVLPIFIGIVCTCVYIVPKKINKMTSLYWYLFIIISMIPVLIDFSFNGIASNKNILLFIYIIETISILGIYLNEHISIKIPMIKISKRAFWTIVIAFIIFSYAYIIYTLGLPKNILMSFKDVYSVRLNYRKSAGRFDDYFIQWLGSIVVPFILTYIIYKKKYKMLPIPFVLELILYSYAAYKSFFAILLLAPFLGFILNKGVRRSFIEKCLVFFLVIGVIAGVMKKYFIYMMIIIRIFLWPSLIAMEYYDFFWMYPKMYLSHSIFGHFIQNVYQMDPSFYLGTLYYGRPDMRLNVTWYGDAYMNFGIIGILVFTLLLYLMFVVIKAIEKKNIVLVSSLLFGGIMALFNGPLLTTMLTSGLGMGILLSYLLPDDM